jgi:hypothetical protein
MCNSGYKIIKLGWAQFGLLLWAFIYFFAIEPVRNLNKAFVSGVILR